MGEQVGRPILKRMQHNLQPTIRTAYREFRGCTMKKRYPTEEKANRAILSILRNGADTNPQQPLNPYPCPLCDGWHVGHSKFRSAEAKAA